MIGAAILMATAGGLWRRWMGGWGLQASRAMHVAAGLLLAISAAIAGGGEPWHQAAAGALQLAMFLPAHGSYMIMGENRVAGDGSFLQPLMLWIFCADRDGDLVYNFTGMVLRYSVFSVPAGVIELHGGDAEGWLTMTAGPLIAAAYLGAWLLRDQLPETPLTEKGGFTSYGEILAGALGIGLLAA
jgi:hypothetical protein